MYSTKHNYDFIVNRCPDDVDVDWKWDPKNEYVSVWYKPEFIKKYLPQYHIFVFVDSDAYFKDVNKTIEDFLLEEEKSTKNGESSPLIYVAEDCKDKNICWTTGPNTGVIIVKNTPKTFEILDEWIKGPTTKMCAFWKYRHTREQGCLWELKNAKYNKEIKVVTPATKLGTHDGDWIVHLAGTSGKFREEYFGDILKKKYYDNFGNSSYIDNNIYNSINSTNMIMLVTSMMLVIILTVVIMSSFKR
jgi:hypothetical protein